MTTHEPYSFLSNEFSTNDDRIRAFKRSCLWKDMQEAQVMLNNFTVIITAKKKSPVYSEITFTYDDVRKFKQLKEYAGSYGFVVPVLGRRDKKILKGEKRIKYKHRENDLQKD